MSCFRSPAIAFGEVVFDCFEDSVRIGGAPLNFAWYLHQFGIPVAVVSAVGSDELGEAAVRFMQEAGIASWVSRRPEPTGTVDITLADGQPDFRIREATAWEHIAPPQQLGGTPSLLYYGTVAQRSETNRATLGALLAAGPRHRFFDVNLRREYFSPQIVFDGLWSATIVKVNEEEWEIVRRITNQDTPAQVLDHFSLEMIALTLGGRGAELYLHGRELSFQGPRVEIVDSVGAGDAFSAALAAGVMLGADPEHSLQVACEAGSLAVRARGAQVPLTDDLRSAFGWNSQAAGRHGQTSKEAE